MIADAAREADYYSVSVWPLLMLAVVAVVLLCSSKVGREPSTRGWTRTARRRRSRVGGSLRVVEEQGGHPPAGGRRDRARRPELPERAL